MRGARDECQCAAKIEDRRHEKYRQQLDAPGAPTECRSNDSRRGARGKGDESAKQHAASNARLAREKRQSDHGERHENGLQYRHDRARHGRPHHRPAEGYAQVVTTAPALAGQHFPKGARVAVMDAPEPRVADYPQPLRPKTLTEVDVLARLEPGIES